MRTRRRDWWRATVYELIPMGLLVVTVLTACISAAIEAGRFEGVRRRLDIESE